MEAPGITVALGGNEYRVIPQRQARLYRKLFSEKGVFDLESLGELTAEADAASIYELASGRLYEVLHVFIPDLMPRWEFEGFASEQDAEQDNYMESADRSPTHPEVLAALQACVTVNGLKWVSKLKDFLDVRLIRATISQRLAQAVTAQQEAQSNGEGSLSLPPESGISDPTPSGTTEPTPPTPTEPVAASDSPSPG